MNIRTTLLLAGLAASLAGCVVTQRTAPPRDHDYRYDHDYDDDYYDYHSTPSYEGYFYVRIIFIRNIPYYVDDNRYIRPIPPHLHDHFRRYPYSKLGRSPVFSRDSAVRDGYPMSRIIYLDGVPYHVEDNRIAQPLPERLHQRFRYTPANQVIAPVNGNRPQDSGQHDNGRNNEAPAYGQERARNRDRDEPSPTIQNHKRIEQPPIERGQREGGNNASTNNTKDNERSSNSNRPQAIESTSQEKAQSNQSRSSENEKQGKRSQAGDNSSSKNKDNGQKTRRGKDDNQEDNKRNNGNKRD